MIKHVCTSHLLVLLNVNNIQDSFHSRSNIYISNYYARTVVRSVFYITPKYKEYSIKRLVNLAFPILGEEVVGMQ
jgi:hypothetical protein